MNLLEKFAILALLAALIGRTAGVLKYEIRQGNIYEEVVVDIVILAVAVLMWIILALNILFMR